MKISRLPQVWTRRFSWTIMVTLPLASIPELFGGVVFPGQQYKLRKNVGRSRVELTLPVVSRSTNPSQPTNNRDQSYCYGVLNCQHPWTWWDLTEMAIFLGSLSDREPLVVHRLRKIFSDHAILLLERTSVEASSLRTATRGRGQGGRARARRGGTPLQRVSQSSSARTLNQAMVSRGFESGRRRTSTGVDSTTHNESSVARVFDVESRRIPTDATSGTQSRSLIAKGIDNASRQTCTQTTSGSLNQHLFLKGFNTGSRQTSNDLSVQELKDKSGGTSCSFAAGKSIPTVISLQDDSVIDITDNSEDLTAAFGQVESSSCNPAASMNNHQNQFGSAANYKSLAQISSTSKYAQNYQDSFSVNGQICDVNFQRPLASQASGLNYSTEGVQGNQQWIPKTTQFSNIASQADGYQVPMPTQQNGFTIQGHEQDNLTQYSNSNDGNYWNYNPLGSSGAKYQTQNCFGQNAQNSQSTCHSSWPDSTQNFQSASGIVEDIHAFANSTTSTTSSNPSLSIHYNAQQSIKFTSNQYQQTRLPSYEESFSAFNSRTKTTKPSNIYNDQHYDVYPSTVFAANSTSCFENENMNSNSTYQGGLICQSDSMLDLSNSVPRKSNVEPTNEGTLSDEHVKNLTKLLSIQHNVAEVLDYSVRKYSQKPKADCGSATIPQPQETADKKSDCHRELPHSSSLSPDFPEEDELTHVKVKHEEGNLFDPERFDNQMLKLIESLKDNEDSNDSVIIIHEQQPSFKRFSGESGPRKERKNGSKVVK